MTPWMAPVLDTPLSGGHTKLMCEGSLCQCIRKTQCLSKRWCLFQALVTSRQTPGQKGCFCIFSPSLRDNKQKGGMVTLTSNLKPADLMSTNTLIKHPKTISTTKHKIGQHPNTASSLANFYLWHKTHTHKSLYRTKQSAIVHCKPALACQ